MLHCQRNVAQWLYSDMYNGKVENTHADFHYAQSEKRREINVGDFYRPK